MQIKPFQPFTLNLRGRLTEVKRPMVMGILNVTPDSFYAESRHMAEDALTARVNDMLRQQVDIIDIGAYSSRPGADDVSPQEETERLRRGIAAIRSVTPYAIVSVDTFRADVARAAIVDMGADIINDISGGDLDPEMANTVADLKVPYIVMHMRGTPSTMQQLTNYPAGVSATVVKSLAEKVDALRLKGVADIICDPGFGFAKTVEQNYELLRNLDRISELLNTPMLVGVSRKSMLTKPMNITPADALPATTAANTLALINGASILRVHDIDAAVQARAAVALTYPSIFLP